MKNLKTNVSQLVNKTLHINLRIAFYRIDSEIYPLNCCFDAIQTNFLVLLKLN